MQGRKWIKVFKLVLGASYKVFSALWKKGGEREQRLTRTGRMESGHGPAQRYPPPSLAPRRPIPRVRHRKLRAFFAKRARAGRKLHEAAGVGRGANQSYPSREWDGA